MLRVNKNRSQSFQKQLVSKEIMKRTELCRQYLQLGTNENRLMYTTKPLFLDKTNHQTRSYFQKKTKWQLAIVKLLKQSIVISQMWSSPEAVAQMCSVKKMFLEISQNSQENTCARVFCDFCEISKSTFFYRTPSVASSEMRQCNSCF